MEKSDRTEERTVIGTAEKGKHTGKVTPLPAGKQTATKAVSKEEIYGQRTMRKVEQKMKKTIFEEMGGTYVRCGDYFIPNLTLPEEEESRFVGAWGQRHLQYLREYRRTVYLDLLMSGRLNSYLADTEEQAQERFERIVEQMKQAQGITEQLKADNTDCHNTTQCCDWVNISIADSEKRRHTPPDSAEAISENGRLRRVLYTVHAKTAGRHQNHYYKNRRKDLIFLNIQYCCNYIERIIFCIQPEQMENLTTRSIRKITKPERKKAGIIVSRSIIPSKDIKK